MKFGETFMEYLHGDQEWLLDKCSHVEFKKIKYRILLHYLSGASVNLAHMFFTELMKEASDIAGCFSSRVRHLLHLHVAKGMQRYALRLRHCFRNDQQAMVEEGRMLIKYVTMNSIAILKILKKYDKVHRSVNGKNFKSKLRAEHIELLQSPWLIELGAFYLNFNGLDGGEFCGYFSCDLNATEPVITLTLPNSIKLDYSLTCAICLETVFNPYALSCGHLFCKSCACSAASVLIFQGLKTANPDKKCPVCREAGVYANSVHMLELDLLLKTR
ncbi:ubiquitin-protein ligase, putative [Ricinus communis]|uniref:RING-type E3 ubiquitin transferase n=1 Tax=Ricinus communis TaxID=3988 RepID=B9SDP3_RICCO|nr:ubiquitin-protein ligase, putative [Ricinus communis]